MPPAPPPPVPTALKYTNVHLCSLVFYLCSVVFHLYSFVFHLCSFVFPLVWYFRLDRHEQSICAQTERVTKVSSCDQINIKAMTFYN